MVHLTVCYYNFMYKIQGESIHFILPEYQQNPCTKEALCLKFK